MAEVARNNDVLQEAETKTPLTILDSIDVATVVMNRATGSILLANNRAHQLLIKERAGQNVGRLEGMPISKFLYTELDSEERSVDLELLSSPGHFSGVAIKDFDGKRCIVDVSIDEIGASQVQNLVLITFKDVEHVQTLLKNLEEKTKEMETMLVELQDQNEKLRKLDDMKNHFISLVSHELRTPLSGMMGYADLLLKGMVDSEEDKKEFLKVIYEEGLRLSDIVNDFLDLSRIMAGKLELFISEMSLVPILRKSVDVLQKFADKYKVKIAPKFDGDDGFVCYVDPEKTQQVFLNVINNACKFSKPETEIEIYLEDLPQHVLVKIVDHGIGIKEENFYKVFSEFEMVESIQEHQKGTGLGMPLSKKFVEAQKGEIWFESTFGVGTTFFIKLPKEKLADPAHYKDKNSEDSNIVF